MAKGSDKSKVYFILYLAVILELLLVIVDRDDAEDKEKKKTDQIKNAFVIFLSGLATTPQGNIKQDVYKIYADLDDNSGKKMRDTPDSLYLTVRGIQELVKYKSVDVVWDSSFFISIKGKDAHEPPSDEIIIKTLENPQKKSIEKVDSTILQIRRNEMITEKIDKDAVLKIPLIVRFHQSGYYKLMFKVELNKLKFYDYDETILDTTNPKKIKLENLVMDFEEIKDILNKGKEGILKKNTREIITDLNNQWNKTEVTLYLFLGDNTIKEVKPPDVQVKFRQKSGSNQK